MEKEKKRAANFSGREKEILVFLVEKYLKVVENKKTNAVFNKQKLDCCDKISVEYNAMQTTGLRTGAQLKATYEKMKQIAKLHKSEDKVEIVKTGGGTFVPKLTSIDEKILDMLKENYFSIPNKFDSNSEVEDGHNTDIIMKQTQTEQNIHQMNYNGSSDGDENIIIICEENAKNTDPNSNEVEHFTVLWTLFIIIVIGNSGVLYSHYIGRHRKSRMKFFIAHLAFADLSVGLISVLTDIVWRMTVTWYAGDACCRFIKFAQALVTYASTYVLVSLSIDRYDAIRYPMKFSGSWRRAKILIILSWGVSALFSIPMLFLYEEKIVQDQKQCWIEFSEQWQWQLYMILISLALFVIPALIITACYAVMIKTIWSKSSAPFTVHRGLRGSFNDRIGSDGDRRASSRGLIPRAKVKTIKITLVIVSVFIVCWSPYIIFDLLQVFGYIPPTQTNTAIASFIQSLAPLNSAANPIIYCIFSTHFCKLLGKIAPFKWCKIQKRRKPRSSTTKSSTISEVLTNNTTKRRSDMVTSINKAHTAIVVALVHEKT